MKSLLKFLGIIAGAITLLRGLGFLLPSQAHVEREITIHASPAQIFPYISDFHAWENWSPWAKIDPNAAFVLTGSGLGQRMEWESENPDVGRGSQEIIVFDAPRTLKTHLEFEGQGIAEATFNLEEEGEQTRLIWSLDSNVSEKTPFLLKPLTNYLGFLLDSVIGPQYESGLRNLKGLVEKV